MLQKREKSAYLVGTVVSGHDPATSCCLPLLPGNRRRQPLREGLAISRGCLLLLVIHFIG